MKPLPLIKYFNVLKDNLRSFFSARKSLQANMLRLQRVKKAFCHWSSYAEDLHLHVLTEPYVNLSAHTALVIQPLRIRSAAAVTDWLSTPVPLCT
jgi:hypothetical protein